MKLMIVSSNFKSDTELMQFLAVKNGMDVIMITDEYISSIRNHKSPASRLQSFKNLLDGKPIEGPTKEDEESEAALDAVNNMAHNKQFVDEAAPMSAKAWEVINNLPHNREADANKVE